MDREGSGRDPCGDLHTNQGEPHHPLFTWTAARYPRKRFIPITWRFFILNLMLFFLTLGVLMVAHTLRRGWEYGLMKPSLEARYTVPPREEKYKAKNFIDAFVYRAGDQTGARSYNGLMALGLGQTVLVFVNVSLLALSMATGLGLGAAQRRKAGGVCGGSGSRESEASVGSTRES